MLQLAKISLMDLCGRLLDYNFHGVSRTGHNTLAQALGKINM
jgi:hypothetical protein